MRKEQKQTAVRQLTEQLGRAKIALVAEQRGITVPESTEMRKRLRAIRGEFKVAKNTLVRRAIKDTAFEKLETTLGGPIGLVLGFEDPITLAKTVSSFRELGNRFKMRGGVLDGRALNAEEVAALATMPPREVVMAQLLGLINAPATRLARLLNEPGSALARVLDAAAKRGAGAAEA